MMKLFLITVCLLFLAPYAYSSSVSLDHVDGLLAPGIIACNHPVTFHIRLTNDNFTTTGICNAFRVYSPDGTQWVTTTIDTVSFGWSGFDYEELEWNFFDIFNFTSRSADGSGADTVGYSSCIMQYCEGMPAGFDEVSCLITIGPISSAMHGRTIGLDSSYSPIAYTWVWCPGSPPAWDGPHVYTVMDPVLDSDSDGIADFSDNCPFVSNRSQTDTDADGVGDLCDDCTDSDSDGLGDPGYLGDCGYDNCPYDYNPEQVDSDVDGIGNICDNCPDNANPVQGDADDDGSGDECDDCTDSDADGFGDPGFAGTCTVDNCPDVYNPDQTDSDGDDIGDACDNCCENKGDFNHDGRVDVADVVAWVGWSFNSNPVGPECEFPEGFYVECDMDASDQVDVADIVYWVNWSFNGGPDPEPCP